MVVADGHSEGPLLERVLDGGVLRVLIAPTRGAEGTRYETSEAEVRLQHIRL